MSTRARESRRVLAPLIGSLALLAATVSAAAASSDGASAVPVAHVSIGATGCSVTPTKLSAGADSFDVFNATRFGARFAVSRVRILVAARKHAVRKIVLQAGRFAFSCWVGNRRVGGGVIFVVAAPVAPPVHRIGVRPGSGGGEFYDVSTGAKFVPRGANYIRLATLPQPSGGTLLSHSTFTLNLYDANRAEAALTRIASDGYNVVRVFVSGYCTPGCLSDAGTHSLSIPYLRNIADFLSRAKAHGVAVILTEDFLPPNTPYDDILNTTPRDQVDNVNLYFLTEQGVRATAAFWHDFAAALIKLKAPTDAIFAYEINNEAAYVPNALPFTRSSGTITTTSNGRTYNLADDADRRRMMDENMVNYVDHVRASIRQVDPTALVTIGFVQPTFVGTEGVIASSTLDFVDLHMYPGTGQDLAGFAALYGINGSTTKPLLMGEFGGFKSVYATSGAAADGLASWQKQSCAYGIDGWLLWTWDTDEQPELWNAIGDNGAVEHALAPTNRADPCT